MKTYIDKINESKSQPGMHIASQKQSYKASGFRFTDKRPDAVAQRKLQAAINKCFSHQQPIQRKGIIQFERYVVNKTSGIHLHLDIGNNDHLQIGTDRYNLIANSHYSIARISEAQKALKVAPYVPDKVACQKELRRLKRNYAR